MNFICTRNILLSAIRNLLSLTSNRSTLPILANALLETTPAGLTVLGTDLETGFQGSYDVTVHKPGRVTVNARALCDVIKELDPEHPITWQADEKHVIKLVSGNSRFTLHGMSADDYPQLPAFDEPAQFSIPSTALLTCLQQVLPAVPDQDQRFVLQSVLITIRTSDSPSIELVGTDGHRLVIAESDAGTWTTARSWSCATMRASCSKRAGLRRLLPRPGCTSFSATRRCSCWSTATHTVAMPPSPMGCRRA